jgi:hypothetical protein
LEAAYAEKAAASNQLKPPAADRLALARAITCRYPLRCNRARISVIKYTAKIQQIKGLQIKDFMTI